jgi:hypothetical protein
MLIATFLSGVLAAISPFSWMVNVVLSAVAYATLCWVTGVLTAGDFMTLRRILLNKPSE